MQPVRPAAKVLGRMLAEAIEELEPEISVGSSCGGSGPFASRKLRQRGFNQAELIARAAMKIWRVPSGLTLCAGALERRRDTLRKPALPATSGARNFGAHSQWASRSGERSRSLLVDDVYTTGATVSECARVLRRAGATKVWVATVARTLKNFEQHVEFSSRTIGQW